VPAGCTDPFDTNAANQQCNGAPQAPLEPYAAPKAVVYFVLAAEEQQREAGELIGTAAAASSMGLQASESGSFGVLLRRQFRHDGSHAIPIESLPDAQSTAHPVCDGNVTAAHGR